MYALLLLLGVSFFFIFFLFSRVPDFDGYFIGSLFLEANIYIIISLISCILVYKNSLNLKNPVDSDIQVSKLGEILPEKGEIKEFFIEFFSSYIYYIAGILFYSAVYLITHSFIPNLDIGYIFLVLNIVVIALYMFPRSFSLGKDLVIVNLVLISLYYIGEHLLYLFSISETFSFTDIINILTVFILFSITLFNQEYKNYRNVIEQYFIVFFFLELSTLYKWIFSGNINSLGIIAGTLAIVLLIFTDDIKKYIRISKNTSRTWGLLFSGISVIIYSVTALFQGQEYILYSLGILLLSIIMTFFHKRFCSYFALSVGALGISSFSYFLYNFLFGEIYEFQYLYLVYISLSFAFIFILTQLRTSFEFDRYFFRIISILVNLIGVITFLFFNEISILSVGLLLLGESVYLFFIYYSLRKINT